MFHVSARAQSPLRMVRLAEGGAELSIKRTREEEGEEEVGKKGEK